MSTTPCSDDICSLWSRLKMTNTCTMLLLLPLAEPQFHWDVNVKMHTSEDWIIVIQCPGTWLCIFHFQITHPANILYKLTLNIQPVLLFVPCDQKVQFFLGFKLFNFSFGYIRNILTRYKWHRQEIKGSFGSEIITISRLQERKAFTYFLFKGVSLSVSLRTSADLQLTCGTFNNCVDNKS